MVKKAKTEAPDQDQQFDNAVRSSAQQIWQAGLGAFAKAQEEGSRVFSKLVKEGTDLQKRTRSMAEEKVSDVRETVGNLAEDMGSKAAGSWDKLEQVFEERVLRALSSIGVPTQKEMQALADRVEQLSKQVEQLSAKAAAVKPAVAKAAAKPAATKVAAKVAGKVATKPAAKPAAKSAAKPASVKPVAKPAVKKAVTKPAVKKAAARPVAKKAATGA